MNNISNQQITDISYLDRQIVWDNQDWELCPNGIWSEESWQVGNEVEITIGNMSRKYTCLKNSTSDVQLHFSNIFRHCPVGKLTEKTIWKGRVAHIISHNVVGAPKILEIHTGQGKITVKIPLGLKDFQVKGSDDIAVKAYLDNGEKDSKYNSFKLVNLSIQKGKNTVDIDHKELEKSTGSISKAVRAVNGNK